MSEPTPIVLEELANKKAGDSRERKAHGGNPIRKMIAERQAPYGTTGPLSERPYSLMRAVAFQAGMIDADQAKEELHIHDELRKHARAFGMTVRRGQLAVPLSAKRLGSCLLNDPDSGLVSEIEQKMFIDCKQVDDNVIRKTMTVGNEAAGGAFVGLPEYGELIDIQLSQEVFSRAGATQTTIPATGARKYPKIGNLVEGYWVGEQNQGTVADMTTGEVLLQAKKLMILAKASIELNLFSNVNAEAEFRAAMMTRAAQKVDMASFTGTGGTQPLGILNYPSQTQTEFTQGVDMLNIYTPIVTGTNGDTFSPEDVELMIQRLPDEAQNNNRFTWAMRPSVYTQIANKRADAVSAGDSAGPFIFPITRDPATRLVRLSEGQVVKSTLIPQTSKGSGTTSPVMVGDFSDWVIGRMGIGLFDSTDKSDSTFEYGLVEYRLIEFVDCVARHPNSFVAAMYIHN